MSQVLTVLTNRSDESSGQHAFTKLSNILVTTDLSKDLVNIVNNIVSNPFNTPCLFKERKEVAQAVVAQAIHLQVGNNQDGSINLLENLTTAFTVIGLVGTIISCFGKDELNDAVDNHLDEMFKIYSVINNIILKCSKKTNELKQKIINIQSGKNMILTIRPKERVEEIDSLETTVQTIPEERVEEIDSQETTVQTIPEENNNCDISEEETELSLFKKGVKTIEKRKLKLIKLINDNNKLISDCRDIGYRGTKSPDDILEFKNKKEERIKILTNRVELYSNEIINLNLELKTIKREFRLKKVEQNKKIKYFNDQLDAASSSLPENIRKEFVNVEIELGKQNNNLKKIQEIVTNLVKILADTDGTPDNWEDKVEDTRIDKLNSLLLELQQQEFKVITNDDFNEEEIVARNIRAFKMQENLVKHTMITDDYSNEEDNEVNEVDVEDIYYVDNEIQIEFSEKTIIPENEPKKLSLAILELKNSKYPSLRKNHFKNINNINIIKVKEKALVRIEKLEVLRLEAERQEVLKLEAERQEVLKLEAERQEVLKLEAERQEIPKNRKERRAANSSINQKRLEFEAIKQEAEKLEAVKLEAEKIEAIKQKAPKNRKEKRADDYNVYQKKLKWIEENSL